jgi:hypothetical protein
MARPIDRVTVSMPVWVGPVTLAILVTVSPVLIFLPATWRARFLGWLADRVAAWCKYDPG